MTTNDPYQLDKASVRRSFDRAATQYKQVAVLQREVASRLVERLDLIRIRPERILELGCGCGNATQGLAQRYGHDNVVALDLSEAMLAQARASGRAGYICGDMENVPCASHSFDLVLSNLSLQWCNDVGRVFMEFKRLLRPGGLVLFTTFGPDTLKELRTSWSKVDQYNHVNGFIDMHHLGDALLEVGFAEPVMDMEQFTLTYPNARKVMLDLKAMGAHNMTAGRPRGLTGKEKIKRVEQAYEQFRNNDVLPATYEVIYGHAWAPTTAQTEVSVDQLK